MRGGTIWLLLLLTALPAAAQMPGAPPPRPAQQPASERPAPSGGMQAPETDLFFGSVPRGTVTAQPLPLSLKDAVERALQNNLGLLLQEESASAARGARWRALADLLPDRRPLPGAVELLRHLSESRILYGIATSGRREDAKPSIAALEIPEDVVVVDRSDVERAKPEPDLFLAVQQRLEVEPDACYVVGDSVWDLLAARRAGMLGIGLLSGGYGEQELAQAGAYRVYRDPAELLSSIYQLGLRAGT
jgi:HAD superfamily hydrolase (TIGR01509 family)